MWEDEKRAGASRRRDSAILAPPLVTTLTALVAAALLLAMAGCEKTTNVTAAETYVSSEACQACHPELYASFSNTGHNLMLNRASDAGGRGYFPYGDLPGPPAGHQWGELSYVVGGFWWKARFVGNDGYVVTGTAAQYNVQTDRWVAYEAGNVVPYACGPCHTTGYRSEGHQAGMPGAVGTWALNGVQCERCHGPGSRHVYAPYDFPLKVDRSAALCGECHSRGDVSKIRADAGFIMHEAQYNELHATKKANFACVDCHDPHVSLHAQNPSRAVAIKARCQTCHFEEAENFAASELPHYDLGTIDCTECHMAYAVKSAEGQPARYRGDVRSHLFRINTNPAATMFTSDGKYANGYLTLEYVCLRCHISRTKQWAEEHAPEVHPEQEGGAT
jgi:hypothetical protein